MHGALAAACALPCTDDGLHARQDGAACLAAPSTTDDDDDDDDDADTTASTGETTTTTATTDATTGDAVCLMNGVLDAPETDVDCGGPACPACIDGLECLVADDCASGACHIAGVCTPPGCIDHLFDPPGETATDCGGVCGETCAPDQHCESIADCLPGLECLDDRCVIDPVCADGVKHPDLETDIDCGGICGVTCRGGELCIDDGDCASLSCTAGICDAPLFCSDGAANCVEPDIDCGGPCQPCASGRACTTDDDCLSGACSSDNMCT
jgi:hypothetical protein